MTAVPPRDENGASEPVTSAELPDEAALERALLAHHAMLMSEARLALGDDAVSLASKIVEGSFVRAWDTRGTIQSSEALEKFLIDDVHHSAARALSRRAAAHRFGPAAKEAHARSIDATPQESWGHVLHALHGEEHGHETLTAMASASRHEAAGHIGGIAKASNRNTTTGIVFGVAAIALLLGGMKVMNVLSSKRAVLSAVNAQDAHPVTTPPGQVGNVNLADGSAARLAPETKLILPKDFGPTLRGARIEGAGAFTLAPKLEHAFELYAGNVEMTSMGGSVIVSAYPSDSTVTLVVTDGSVDVRQGKTSQVVQKGSAVISRGGEALRAATAQERDAAMAWTTDTLVVTDRRLGDVLALMKRWYGYEIRLPDLKLADRKVTMRASLDSAMQAVHLIEKSANMELGYAGQNMVLRESTKGGKVKK